MPISSDRPPKQKWKPLSSDTAVKAAEPGWHTVTGASGLLLRVHEAKDGSLTRGWIVRLSGRRSKRSLGQYPLVSLAEARQKAMDFHRAAAEGIDPGVRAKRLADVVEAARTLTLGKAIDDYLAKAATVLKNAKSDEIRTRALRVHFAPLHGKDVTALSALDVADILRPLRPQTAIKSHTAIRAVFDFAAEMLEPYGVRISNPADPRRLKAVGWTPKPNSQKVPQPAVGWRQMPEVVDELGGLDGVDVACLRFIIATCVRAGTARLAKWRDIDFVKNIWTVPRADLKDDKHRKASFIVPLNSLALDVLKMRQMRRSSSPYVFEGSGGRPIRDMDLVYLVRRLRRAHDGWRDPQTQKPFTTHGFRASFKTWSREADIKIRRSRHREVAHIPVRELAELVPGHRIGSDVEQAYDRSDLLDARREIMDLWSNHCRAAKILPFPVRA
jgi:integrase